MTHTWVTAPDWSAGTLADVLPEVAGSLGVAPFGSGDTRRALAVLVDGMGYDLLTARSGHAPFLRTLLPTARRLYCGFPSTTATSMGTFGTGLPPGSHGLVGFEVVDPDRDVVFNELSWEDGPEPSRWQPYETVFEAVAGAGIPVTRIGPGFFDGSGLTNSALRGGRFVAARTLEERCDAAVTALSEADRGLTYLYWGDLDKTGHVHGAASWQWGEELTAIDGALQRCVEALPAGTTMYVTADHGMVDIPYAVRVDLAIESELLSGVRRFAGEPRSVQLHCEDGALDDVRAAWAERFGPDASIRTREELMAAGWFGVVRPEVSGRIGDLIINLPDGAAVVHSGQQRPEFLALIGWHGSVTAAETGIPLLVA